MKATDWLAPAVVLGALAFIRLLILDYITFLKWKAKQPRKRKKRSTSSQVKRRRNE